MLINLSNHPTDQWDAEQLFAAQAQFGEVDFIQHPNIPPNWNREQVETLANEYVNKILVANPKKDLRIHVVGEPVFCFCFITRMRQEGIPCLTSTTERMVEVRDNKKIITFRFESFRYYF
ncbi:MAG: CRISPR-associated protein [Saprospiraceae bacterium]